MNFDLYWERIEATIVRFFPRVLIAILILLILRYIVQLASAATHRALKEIELAQEIEDLIARSARILVIIGGLIIILFVLGWGELALSFVAGLGISGLVIGFALQDITKNFAAGLMLLFQRPFKLGDRIIVAGEEGTVEDIALRATTLRSDDGRELLIPNASIYTGNIANLSRYQYRRHTLDFKLKGDTPLQTALPHLEQTITSMEGVQTRLPTHIVVKSIQADSVDIEARFWLPSDYPQAPKTLSQIARAIRNTAQEQQWLA